MRNLAITFVVAFLLTTSLWTMDQNEFDQPKIFDISKNYGDRGYILVQAVALSPDGTTIALGLNNGHVKLFDAKTGACIQNFKHPEEVYAVAFINGTHLAASADETIKIWNMETGVPLKTFEGVKPFSLAVNKAGTQLAAGGYKMVTNGVGALYWHGIALTSGLKKIGVIKIWDIDSQKTVIEKDMEDTIRSVAFNHDDTEIVAGSHDGNIYILNINQVSLRVLRGHRDWVWHARFNKDSTRIISGSRDHSIKLWDAMSGTCLQTFMGHENDVLSVAFAEGETKIISVSEDDSIKIWLSSGGKSIKSLKLPVNYSKQLVSMFISNDGLMVAAGGGSAFKKFIVWNISSLIKELANDNEYSIKKIDVHAEVAISSEQ